jgi:hypothetical protein
MLEPKKPGEGGTDPTEPGVQQQQTDTNKLSEDQAGTDRQGDTSTGSQTPSQ